MEGLTIQNVVDCINSTNEDELKRERIIRGYNGHKHNGTQQPTTKQTSTYAEFEKDAVTQYANQFANKVYTGSQDPFYAEPVKAVLRLLLLVALYRYCTANHADIRHVTGVSWDEIGRVLDELKNPESNVYPLIRKIMRGNSGFAPATALSYQHFTEAAPDIGTRQQIVTKAVSCVIGARIDNMQSEYKFGKL